MLVLVVMDASSAKHIVQLILVTGLSVFTPKINYLCVEPFVTWTRPHALQRATDGASMLPLSPQRVVQKPIFKFFKIKFQFQLN